LKTDIKSPEDIELLITGFYKKALLDPEIGHFFTTVIPLNLETHIPKICLFWESILFGNTQYAGNPMQVHQQIHNLSEINTEHLNRWLQLFTNEVDKHFIGKTADLAKTKARSIATVMQIKFHQE